MIEFLLIFLVCSIWFGGKEVIKYFEQKDYERRRFYLMVAAELDRMDKAAEETKKSEARSRNPSMWDLRNLASLKFFGGRCVAQPWCQNIASTPQGNGGLTGSTKAGSEWRLRVESGSRVAIQGAKASWQILKNTMPWQREASCFLECQPMR